MSPGEKAEELRAKYQKISIDQIYTDSDGDTAMCSGAMTYKSSVQCAIITVEEIIELDVTWIRQSIADDYPKTYSQDQTKEYWHQVLNTLKSMQS